MAPQRSPSLSLALILFISEKLGLLAVEDIMTHEGESDTTEVAATTETSNHCVGIFTCHGHLLLGFKTDDGLVQTHVVEHRAKGVFTVRRGGCQLYCFGDGGTQRTLVIGVVGDDVLTSTR